MEKSEQFSFTIREIIMDLIKAGKLPEEAKQKGIVTLRKELDLDKFLSSRDCIRVEV